INELHGLRAKEPRVYEIELRRLLNRFITVCNTIEYAHSRGILHRDLKPDNIMLGPFGETLVVDWGLAKVIAPSSETAKDRADASQVDVSPASPRSPAILLNSDGATQAGTVVGTLAYMSPEQALGWNDTLTPAADVYSLGATLYALITGNVPDVGRDLATIVVRVRKKQYARPRELNPTVPIPLEAICLKAMEGATVARYRSAADLARDLESYLADEPVTAWVEPLRVRAGRWMRRHRTFVTSTVGVGTAVIIALVAIVALQKNANEKLAESRDREKQNFDMARDAVDTYFTQVSEDPRLAAVGLEPLRRDLLGTAGEFYEQFVRNESSTPELTYELGWAKFRMAAITEEIGSPESAITQLQQASQHFRDLLKLEVTSGALEGLLFCNLNLVELYTRTGRKNEALNDLMVATDIARDLAQAYPDRPSFQNHLARCFAMQAQRWVNLGKLDAAADAYQEELAVRRRITELDPEKPVYQHDQATLYRNLANLDQRREQLDAARNKLQLSLEIERRLVRDNPADASFADSLARSATLIGDVETRSGRIESARRAYEEAVSIRGNLVKTHPDVLDYRAELVNVANHFGSFLYDRGELEPADAQFRRAFSNAERLVEDHPEQAQYQISLAAAATNWGMLCAATNRLPFAEQLLARAEEIRKRLLELSPDDEDHKSALAGIGRELAGVEKRSGRADAAQRHLEESISSLSSLIEKHPDRPKYVELLSLCSRDLGDLFKDTGRTEEAIAQYGRAMERLKPLVDARYRIVSYRIGLAAIHVQVGSIRYEQQKLDEAMASFDAALTLFDENELNAMGRDGKLVLRNANAGRALVLEQTGKHDEAVQSLNRAIGLGSADDSVGLRLKRAGLLMKSGRADEAVAEAEALTTEAAGYGPALFELATIFARSIDAVRNSKAGTEAEREALSEERARKAISLLQRAHEAGHFLDAANRDKLKSAVFENSLGSIKEYRTFREAIDKLPANRTN
ncbi:MAG: protein kinase, partial [Planctomycetaceae bacterium]